MFSLNGKKALITGATGGIGEGIAQALAAQGAIVALSGTRKEKLEELQGQIAGSHILPCNLMDAAAVDALPGQAEAALGGLDILVANAGITKDGLAMRMKDEDFEAVLTVNLTATFRLMRGSLKGMMKQRWGRIVSIGSVVGSMGNPGQVNYCASKAGLLGLTKSLAQETASRGITANVVAPGFIATPMTHALNEEQTKRITQNIPAQRFGQPGDIAAAVCFLASEEASYITGQTIHVNGGLYMV